MTANGNLHRVRSLGNLSTRLAEVLRGRIMRGDYRPGGRIDTEAELSATFGLSRTTVRAAIRALVDEGYLRSRQGSGTYVADDPPRQLPNSASVGPVLHGFLDDLYAESAWARELSVTLGKVPAPADVAELLQRPAGSLVEGYFHVRGRANEPYGYGEDYFSDEVSDRITEDLLRTAPTFLHALTRIGFRPTEMMHGFEPDAADEDVAAKLLIEPGDAVIKSLGVLLDDEGRTLSVYRFFIRKGRGIQVHLARVGELPALVADWSRVPPDPAPLP